MAAWLIPALKTVLPHVGTIISAATPVFTKKSADANPAIPAHEQINELQIAASQNAAHIKDLAAQLHSTVAAIEQAAAIAEAKLKCAVLISFGAIALSLISLVLAAYLIFSR